jgi:hypothetical protein
MGYFCDLKKMPKVNNHIERKLAQSGHPDQMLALAFP